MNRFRAVSLVLNGRRELICQQRFDSTRSSSSHAPLSTVDDWVEREARPISLRQLTVFGRHLTDDRLISSANYIRTEIPTRLAHRLRDLQTLPYIVITNPHMKHVYDLYHKGFDMLRRFPEVKTVEENDQLCKAVRKSLDEHLSVIPRLVLGVLETRHLIPPEKMDELMNTMLRSRISRRVILEQHLALTENFHSPWYFADAKIPENHTEFIGEVFLKCNARASVEHCAETVRNLSRQAYGPDVKLPEVHIMGELEATLTYIPSHLEYVIGELLRNSFQALVERRHSSDAQPPPIEVLICEGPQHVIFRISDQGGGVDHGILPYLWSFVKGPRRKMRLENLYKVPQMVATLGDLKTQQPPHSPQAVSYDHKSDAHDSSSDESLASLTGRPPNLLLGIGLPMSRVYAEFWAGSLNLHSLEGYGVDAYLHVSKLGNKNEQLVTRAAIDAL